MSKEQAERMKQLSSAAAKVVRDVRPLLDAGKYAEAERSLESTLLLYPRLVSAKTLLAESLIRQGKDAQALPILVELQERQHVLSEGSAVRLALVRARLGQAEASRADWNPQIVLRYCDGLPEAKASLPSVASPKGLETVWTIATGYLTDLHGDTTGAAFFYGRALALDPNNAFINLKMGDLELRTGKAASAVVRYGLAAKGTGQVKEIAERQGAIAKSIADASAKKILPTAG